MVAILKKNMKGFTLTEVIMTLMILGIISGIATISYRGTMNTTKKSDMRTSAQMFVASLKNCISASGGWEVQAGTGTELKKPCLVKNTNNINTDLKKQLNYDCPAGATCKIRNKQHKSIERRQYVCLSIEKTVSGKKLQVITRVQWSNLLNYKILCGEVSNFVDLRNPDDNCKGYDDTSDPPDPLSNMFPCEW